MADITLSTAVRTSLLSLQGTSDLIGRTQNRLSTGLKVSSAIDDPVAFFQGKALSDRAGDFQEKKDAIDQSISNLTTATDGLNAVESIVRQLKGIAQNLKSATGTQFTDLVTQFNDLRDQIDLLTTDSTYQGVNLINGTGQTLTVEFSDKTTSKLSVSSVDVTGDGLGTTDLTKTTASGSTVWNTSAVAVGDTLTSGGSITATFQGDTVTLTGGSTAASFTVGTATVTVTLTVGANTSTFTQGTAYTFTVATAGDTGATNAVVTNLTALGTVTATAATSATLYVREGSSTTVDAAITELSTALTTLRSEAGTLGSNVALLQTRLDFTNNYVDSLEGGSAKLTLADINGEGANLLALQTRQQLGIQALAFAGQAESSVLGLFR